MFVRKGMKKIQDVNLYSRNEGSLQIQLDFG